MLQCPKCRADMRPVTHESIQVDRCTRCGGLWFDLLEHEDLRSVDGSERIDSGDTRLAGKQDVQDKAFCPHDESRLTRMVVAGQPHIWYEMCPVCHGAFFDAGEFSDFKEHSFAESIFKRGRKRAL
jgi:Zn-finger nucleic acid-binding protein